MSLSKVVALNAFCLASGPFAASTYTKVGSVDVQKCSGDVRPGAPHSEMPPHRGPCVSHEHVDTVRRYLRACPT